jgi:hypothetical protein
MSRGAGSVMRAALAHLEASDGPLDASEIAVAAYRVDPDRVTHAQLVAVRRALTNLVRCGEVRNLGRHWRGGRARYASPSAAARYEARVRATFGKV